MQITPKTPVKVAEKHNKITKDATRTLLRVWKNVTMDNLKDGIQWYDAARTAAHTMDDNLLRAAGVIAALSPRQTWDVNKRQAKVVLDAARQGLSVVPNVGLGMSRDKAWTIANLQNPTVSDILAILHGPKITRFFLNIIGDDNAVTVDVWATRAAGHPDRVPDGLFYGSIERAYQSAAERVGMTPRVFQAAVWCHVRGKAN